MPAPIIYVPTSTATRKHRLPKPTFGQLVDALSVLCQAKPAYYSWLISQSVGNYDDAQIYLEQLACTAADEPVIQMLALQAMKAR
jgi:hypothetical protein